MISNHPYRCWHPSEFINECIYGVDTLLYKQPNKWITTILAKQHSKEVPCVDGWKLAHFLLLPWMMCDVPWAPIIHVCVDIPLNPSVGAWVRLIHQYTKQPSKGIISILATQHCKVDKHGGKKTGILLASVLDGVWCSMRSNHPYRCWHHSQFISVCMCEVGLTL